MTPVPKHCSQRSLVVRQAYRSDGSDDSAAPELLFRSQRPSARTALCWFLGHRIAIRPFVLCAWDMWAGRRTQSGMLVGALVTVPTVFSKVLMSSSSRTGLFRLVCCSSCPPSCASFHFRKCCPTISCERDDFPCRAWCRDYHSLVCQEGFGMGR